MKHQRRNATVRALAAVDVVVLGGGDFDLLVGAWSHLGYLLEDMAAKRDGVVSSSRSK